jgi:hypothetical protein
MGRCRPWRRASSSFRGTALNVIFLTQGLGLEMFFDLMRALRGPLQLDRVGFYVSDSRFYRDFARRHPEIEGPAFQVAKEWEAWRRARAGIPDRERLRRYEETLGDPTLWSAVVADRRMYMGRQASLHQDYRPRIGPEPMLRVLEETILEVERLFDAVRPDLVVSFICVSAGEYLGFRLAASRGIRFLNLRATRIRNHFIYSDHLFDPPARARRAFDLYQAGAPPDAYVEAALEYIRSVRETHAHYDGVVLPSRRPRVPGMRLTRAWRTALELVRDEIAYRAGGREDPQAVSRLASTWHKRIANPWRAFRLDRRHRDGYVLAEHLGGLDYVFYPMHTEPEMSLLVKNRTSLNQIEVVRHLSRAVPLGWRLLVKEHPRQVGRRSLGYYQKLLEIPNVALADPALGARELIEGARLVALVGGSIGLEALIREKPVVCFGMTPYEHVSPSMIRRVTAEDVSRHVHELLSSFRPDQRALTHHVAATLRESVAVNLYTTLLRKQGDYRVDRVGESERESWDRAVRDLADYTVDSLRRPAGASRLDDPVG